MSHRPIRSAVLLTALFTVGLTAPAMAHEEINPNRPIVGQPTFLTLNAANEKKTALVKVTLTAPSDLPFGATTREPAGWTVDRTDAVVTWSGGKVAPDGFESWGFEIEGADQAKAYTYKVALGFADGTTDPVSVVVNAVAGATVAKAAAKTDRSARGLSIAALALAVVALASPLARGRSRRGQATEGSGDNEW